MTYPAEFDELFIIFLKFNQNKELLVDITSLFYETIQKN